MNVFALGNKTYIEKMQLASMYSLTDGYKVHITAATSKEKKKKKLTVSGSPLMCLCDCNVPPHQRWPLS